MNQDFNDPEIFADFIIEAKEHLETIEPNLLELEKTPENLDLCNAIFRPMHSLKGASGFLGLNTINRLAHKAENIMEELRRGDMPVTPEIMDVILSSTDALRQLVDNLEISGSEGDVEVDHIISTIESLLAGEVPPPIMGGATEDPEPDPVAESEETPASEASNDSDEDDSTGSYTELPPYILTTFGEGHLNDFLEEAHEIISNLNSSLLELEKDPKAGGELVNDIFRYFHNLKGNSGIIGFRELNSLTHEAETLLNRVRKGEMESTHALIDLLLSVVDLIEALVEKVNITSGQVTPVDIDNLVERLQAAVANGVVDTTIEEDDKALEKLWDEVTADEGQQAPEAGNVEEPAPAPKPGPAKMEAPAAPPVDNGQEFDPEDVSVFESTVEQQLHHVDVALRELEKDSSQQDYVDGLYRSLITLQNSSGYMGLEEVKVYAERTAKLVDQVRKTGMDFEPMLDIMRQEAAILGDMLHAAVDSLLAAGDAAAEAAPPPTETAKEPAKTEGPAAAEPPRQEVKGAYAPTPKAEVKTSESVEKAPPPAAEKTPLPKQEQAHAAKPEAKPEPKPAPPKPAPPKPAAPKPAAPASPPQNANAQQQPKPKVSSTIRVDHEKLDHLMNLIGELIINRNRYSMLARSLEEGMDVSKIAASLTETTYAMARISDDLQDTIMKVRMVPVQTVFSRFPRLVRDLSRKSNKRVELITEGEETELDKSVVEVIGDPLVHLIRNSVDHGIEPEDERVKVGKNPSGKVWLRAYHRGNSVAIEVEDDGRGIDPEKMRQSAVNKGIIGQDEAKNLDDREALELIFAPGFSTAAKVTDISGRGVGMDVVRTNIKNLKGSVNITSDVGKGSKFILSLPLTLAIIDALMVKVAGQTFAIPLDAVSETTKIEAERLTDVNSRKAVTLRGEVLGVVDLRELLEMPPREETDILSVLVIHDNDRRLGIIVDSLLERQEIVIKSLGTYLGDQKGLSGATIMGDGSVVLILDPHEIYIMATSKAL